MAEDRLTTSPGVMAKQWHYRPATPIQVSPFFSGPFSIKNCLEWIASRWLRVCENSILLGLSIFCWFYLQPPLETTKVLADRLDRCDVCPQSGFNDAGRRGTASVFLRIHNDKVIFLSLMRAHSKQMRARSHSTIKFSIIYFGRSSAGSRFGRPMKS